MAKKQARGRRRRGPTTRNAAPQRLGALGRAMREIVRSFSRLVAWVVAFAKIVLALYQLWLLRKEVARVRSHNPKDKLANSLVRSLGNIKITTNLTDIDVALAYAEATPRIISRSSCPTTVALVMRSCDLASTLQDIRYSLLYAQGVIRHEDAMDA